MNEKRQMNEKNIKKIYKSESRLRSNAKDMNNLDKLCTDLMGPAGSKEWLANDMELIGKK